MTHEATLRSLLAADPARWRLLEIVDALGLPDTWIAAGFVRNAVWDFLHGRDICSIDDDVDVVWFDAERVDPSLDRDIEAALRATEPAVAWSVKNQARMHLRNGDAPYASATDAMRFWPETATAVGARIGAQRTCEITAPLGLDDLFDLVVRPSSYFPKAKHGVCDERWASKRWSERWPLLRRER